MHYVRDASVEFPFELYTRRVFIVVFSYELQQSKGWHIKMSIRILFCAAHILCTKKKRATCVYVVVKPILISCVHCLRRKRHSGGERFMAPDSLPFIVICC